MNFTKEQIEELQSIILEEYGVTMTTDETIVMAARTVLFFEEMFKMTPSERAAEHYPPIPPASEAPETP